MNDLNNLTIIGRLTKDPELKATSNSKLVNFSIANNSKYGNKEQVHFFDCVAWAGLAEVISQYAKKGKQVLIQGRLEQNTWQTQEGNVASRVIITVEFLQFLGDKKEGADPV